MDTPESLASLDELAHVLNLSRRWLIREVRARRIPFLQAGRRRLFSVHAVRRVLAERAAVREDAAREK